ncbi:MAG: LamG domain-containing protein [Paludisphaera borealis]|uniref:LamG domain-containing protein n=1 Tax=Paludisphaera borealis TaxID=1387353 RepID=UPI00283E1619|nr:LamG domain-containing protein [Paludisphaera borealis]MDR3618367.1 LamG domain-containing protein [Paludisphaera borealis]
MTMTVRFRCLFVLSLVIAAHPINAKADDGGTLKAGAFAIDVSPQTFPVIVNGGFLQAKADKVRDPVFARCLVIDDGKARLAIAIVDSCMMPRELIDQAKALAHQKTGIAVDRMLIAATHTHTAPSVMGALGTPVDPAYAAFLPAKIAEGIERAAAALTPAKVGWAAIDDEAHTHCRRWIRRSDRMIEDPFGVRNVRANMHPGHVNPDVVGPSGAVDPGLTLLAIQSTSGRPIAVLANYSMHYFGSEPVSADYYGRFAKALARKLGAEAKDDSFVAIMSQGTSGDQQWMDYGKPSSNPGIDAFADQVADTAFRAYQSIKTFDDHPPVAMAQTELTLRRRTPDAERLKWARAVVDKMGDRVAQSIPEVYAKEAIHLHDEPERTLKLQAIRIGGLGVAAIPDEVYGLTGLKIKARSPLATTMNIELANGSEGYIPPPEQHALGGYTTWPARTAGLEVEAEPRIVDAVLGLLEQVAGQPRRQDVPVASRYAQIVLASRPSAFWRLDEMDGAVAHDASGREHPARRSPGVALYLPGPELPGFRVGVRNNRANHLAGGTIAGKLDVSAEVYAVDFWFWNGVAKDAVLLERSRDKTPGDALNLTLAGRLAFTHGPGKPDPAFVGKTEIAPKTWHHVALVRQGRRVVVYLDGKPEIRGETDADASGLGSTFTLGDRLEGKLDEVAIYDRALAPAEVAEHVKAATDPTVD